jgi:hypothetical protein
MHACVNLHLRYCIVSQIKNKLNGIKGKLCSRSTAWVTQVATRVAPGCSESRILPLKPS